MCGRPLWCKGVFGRFLAFGAFAVVCPALWRGTAAAGPDGFRARVRNGQTASEGQQLLVALGAPPGVWFGRTGSAG